MAEQLRFDVIGKGDGSDIERLAHAVDNLTDQLKQLDRVRANPTIRLNTRRAHLDLVRFATSLDNRMAAAAVRVVTLGRALGALAIPVGLVGGLPQIASLGAAVVEVAGAIALLPAVGVAGAAAIGTLVMGFEGFGDVLKALSKGDVEKFNEAIKSLAPSARDFAIALRDLGPAWNAVRLDVQERLFRGIGQATRDLSGKYLPSLQSMLGGIADGYNRAATESAKFLLQAPIVQKLGTAFDQVRQGVTNALGSLRPFTEALVSLVAVGASRLPALGQALADVTVRFRDWIVAAERSGDLGRWIDKGLDRLRQLGQIAINVGASLGEIFSIAEREGADFLTTLERVTGGIRTFLSSAQGQETVGNVFRVIRETVEAAWPGVQALGQAIGDVINRLADNGVLQGAARAFTSIAQAAAPLIDTLGVIAVTVLPPLFSALSALAPVLVPVAAGMLAVAAAARAMAVVSALGTAMSGFAVSVIKAEGGMGKFKTAIGGLGAFLGAAGPLGLGIAVAITALGFLIGAFQDAGAAAAEQKARIDSLVGSLQAYTGAATEATRAQVAQELGTKKLSDGTTSYADALKRAGVDTRDFVDATTGNEAALQKVRTQLDSHVATLIKASPAYANNVDQLQRMGISLQDLAAAAQGNVPALDRINAAINASSAGAPEARSGLELLRDELIRTGGASAEMGRELNRMAAEYGLAAQAARDAGAANLVFADVLEAVKAGLAGIAAGAKPTEEMAKRLADLGAAADIAAKSAGDSAAELTGLAGGAAAAGAAMAESRQAFIEAATAAGIAAPAAEELANQIGLIPSAASIIFQTNATGVAAEMITLNERIKLLPPNTSITVTDLSGEARANLERLGFTIQAIPGTKDVKVTAPTDQAKASLDAFVALANGTTVTITGDMNVDPATNKITQTVQLGNGQTAVMTYDANASAADGKIHATVTYGNGQTATLIYDANPDPATGQINAVVTYADGSTGTVTINPNDLVTPTIDQLKNPTASLHTINPNAGPAEAARTGVQQPTQNPHTVGSPTTDNTQGPRQGASAPTTNPHTVGSPTTDNTQGARTGAAAPTANPHTVGSPLTDNVPAAKATASQPSQSLHTINADDKAVVDAKSRAEQPTSSMHTINCNDSAVTSAKAAAQRATSSTHTIHVQVVGAPIPRAAGAYATPRAEGAYAAAYAAGGMRRMSAARAEIVPPRQPRLIGDRMRGDEAFIPINNSARSTSILNTAAQRMGYDLVPKDSWVRPMAAMASSSTVEAASAPTMRVAGGDGEALITEMRGLRGELRALRGDVDHHGDNASIVGELRAVRAVLGRIGAGRGSAVEKAQSWRTDAELGRF